MQIAIVLYPGVTALDAIGPYEFLRSLPGAEVRFVGAEPGPIVADSGVLFLGVTHTYAETPRPDIVLVPGSGPSTASAMADTELIDWLRRVHETTQWTTSVCTGALILGAAGILTGKPATTHWTVQRALAAFGAEARKNDRIVRADKVATAAGVSAGLDLGLWLVGEIAGRDHAEIVQLYIEYDPQPPFDAGHPSKARKEITDRAYRLSRKIAFTPSQLGAVAVVAWRQTLTAFRSRRNPAHD
ncbi:DJ-1/PfpI family protein [Actinoplanes aureus]|uniref:DJ-1/PfpI family protein n=1 Tax=Actinoplanes aureus TaxID=2792083 RepID=A0A931CCX7_9ACTN|nr:DJ-1/PfpI family protein [Actinoplanes aureus]MBG0567605.1 DJ-1/PfpI family protein [Actinoplanes aureus]